LRRTLRGYHQLAERNLWLFLAESEARYNFRNNRGEFFEHLVSHWPDIDVDDIRIIKSEYDWRI
jgi:hypothetical protein